MNIPRKHPNGKRHAMRFSPESLAMALGFPEGSRVYVIEQFYGDDFWSFCAEFPEGVEPLTTEQMRARNEIWRSLTRLPEQPASTNACVVNPRIDWPKVDATSESDIARQIEEDDREERAERERVYRMRENAMKFLVKDCPEKGSLGVVINDPNGGRS